MSNPKAPTRQELSRFLPDHRLVRAFEELFRIIPSSTADLSINIGTAIAKVNQANAMSQQNLENIKGVKVLLWLSM